MTNELTKDQVADDEEVSPARGLAIDTLGYVPRLVAGALEDLRIVAESVRVLPEVARSLTAIQASVDSMDREVRLMRQGVDQLGGKVDGLDVDIRRVVDGVEPLGEKVEDLRRTLHPMSRVTSLLGRRGVADGESELPAPDRDRSSPG